MKLNKQQFAEALLGLKNEADGSSIEATFSEIKIESYDTAIIEVKDADSDGDLDIVGVAPGTAQIKVSAVVSYTDPATGKPVVAGKDADPVDVTVDQDETKTKLVVSFTDGRDLPVVEEPPVEGEGSGNQG